MRYIERLDPVSNDSSGASISLVLHILLARYGISIFANLKDRWQIDKQQQMATRFNPNPSPLTLPCPDSVDIKGIMKNGNDVPLISFIDDGS